MQTLKQRLTKWFKTHPEWHASGDVQRMVSEKTTYTPQNVGRRLRELVEENTLQVEYRKNHAYYRIAPQTPLKTQNTANGEGLQATLKAMSEYWDNLPIKSL